MGNTKVYTFRFPLLRGEQMITRDALVEAARSSIVVVDAVTEGDETVVVGLVGSCSMSADHIVEVIRARYPGRWCVFTRFDADWPDFQVFSWDEDSKEPDVSVADGWRRPVATGKSS